MFFHKSWPIRKTAGTFYFSLSMAFLLYDCVCHPVTCSMSFNVDQSLRRIILYLVVSLLEGASGWVSSSIAMKKGVATTRTGIHHQVCYEWKTGRVWLTCYYAISVFLKYTDDIIMCSVTPHSPTCHFPTPLPRTTSGCCCQEQTNYTTTCTARYNIR